MSSATRSRELAPPTAVLAAFEPAVKRWLAARLFGTWIAYQGDGLLTIVRYLRACFDVFTVELARDGQARAGDPPRRSPDRPRILLAATGEPPE